MLFQETLKSKVSDYIVTNSLPRTLLLEGEQGCGKHTLAKEIAKALNVEFVDITETLNLQTIENIALSVTPRVYFINASVISVKEQNIILKFLEEPLKGAYIILACENRNLLLNTVINRCIVLEFQKYTFEQLKEFLPEGADPVILSYATTPGRVVEFAEHNIKSMEEFATKILSQIQAANYSNILKIPTNINFSNKTELLDFSVFSYILLMTASRLYKEGVIKFCVFKETSEFYKNCSIPHINKQHLFEHYLIKLKQVLERS